VHRSQSEPNSSKEGAGFFLSTDGRVRRQLKLECIYRTISQTDVIVINSCNDMYVLFFACSYFAVSKIRAVTPRIDTKKIPELSITF
jgi:hypothetical protein